MLWWEKLKTLMSRWKRKHKHKYKIIRYLNAYWSVYRCKDCGDVKMISTNASYREQEWTSELEKFYDALDDYRVSNGIRNTYVHPFHSPFSSVNYYLL